MKKLLILLTFFTFELNAQCPKTIQYSTDCSTAPLVSLTDINNGCLNLPESSGLTTPLCWGNDSTNGVTYTRFTATKPFIRIFAYGISCTVQDSLHGLLGGIYEGSCNNFVVLSCNGECNTDSLIFESHLNIGQQYWLILDGCNGSRCKVRIHIEGYPEWNDSQTNEEPGIHTTVTSNLITFESSFIGALRAELYSGTNLVEAFRSPQFPFRINNPGIGAYTMKFYFPTFNETVNFQIR